ncbi:PilZ domain-containing protein [Thiomicrorhabdus cannonii]|uniref:PilZ domain-containing protein n=1 Tax=Thiomicrorhabdus cannonii TaxID=2748011 RepID=UPI0015BDC1D0|nr:PilZ domain-containing protein [Thiomicrorhabdus cannonii]
MTNAELHQRAKHRVTLKRPVELLINNDEIVHGTLLNLSILGAGVLLDRALQPLQRLSMKFSLPAYDDDIELVIDAQTTHVTSSGAGFLTGIEFSLLSPHQSLVIGHYANSSESAE